MWEEKKGRWGGYEKRWVRITEPIAFNTVTHQRNAPDTNSYRPFLTLNPAHRPRIWGKLLATVRFR